MTVYVFTGPTLTPADGRAHLDAVYLPPAAQGDVYRAARTRPAAIGIIDGYFDTLPAIWHKEILWAIHEGIPVFGSGSMGALRAAELAAFGMRGVGDVFEAFRSGALEDDDEVTLAHEPEASGFRALSVPMVDLRATLKSALAARVIAETTHDGLLDRMKRLFYPDRSYRRLLAEGAAAGWQDEMGKLEAWLPTGRVDAKRLDAIAMLGAMKAHLARGEPEPRGAFHFQQTTYWEGLRRSCDAAPVGRFDPPMEPCGVLDELRLQGSFEALRARAVNRVLARVDVERQGYAIEPERLVRAAMEFRQNRGLTDAASFQTWLAARDLDEESFARILEGHAAEQWALPGAEIARHALDEAKLDERYPALRERALRKDEALSSSGHSEPGLAAVGLSREQLFDWYFREVARSRAPNDVTSYARGAGFEDEAHFVRALVREHLFHRSPTAAKEERTT
jgi:hypothetical protein